MAKVTLNPATNFYATPEELAEWLKDCYQRHRYHYVFTKASKRLVLTQDVDWDDQRAVVRAVQKHSDVFMSIDPLNLDVTHANQIASLNEDGLWVFLGDLSSHGLNWSILNAGTTIPRYFRVWRQVADALEQRTDVGAWYGGPGRKSPLFEPDVRFTPGAAKLFAEGVPLLGGGSTRIVKLGRNKG